MYVCKNEMEWQIKSGKEWLKSSASESGQGTRKIK
jgi:hypothetical protein